MGDRQRLGRLLPKSDQRLTPPIVNAIHETD